MGFQIVSLTVLLSIAAARSWAMGDIAGAQDSFPGWLGATSTRESHVEPTRGSHVDPPRIPGIDSSRIVQLSAWKPRAYLYKGFLTEKECDHLMRKAYPNLRRSSVADNTDGKSVLSQVRTSSGTFIRKGEDEVVKGIEQRVSEWTLLPVPNQEALQILRYEKGQKYEPHVDYFHDPVNKQRGGHRYATVLMYLNTPELGGETVFPTADDATPKDDSWSDCAKGKLAVKPQKGDALLFFSMHPDGTPDDTSLHYACPVLKGEKWSAPMWIHVADFDKVYQEPGNESADGCSDTNALCPTWASQGECKKNPQYMQNACKRSCSAC